MNDLVLINVKELRKSINRYASRTEKTYSYVLRKLFGVSTSTFSEAIARFNKSTGNNSKQDVYGYLTKSMYQRLEKGFNEHIAPVFFLSKSYFYKKFFVAHVGYDTVKKSVKEDTNVKDTDIEQAENKIEQADKIKRALNSFYGISCMDERTSINSAPILQMELGRASNLITDMTLNGAPEEDISYAVYFSKDLIEMIKKYARFKQLVDKYCAKKV